MLYGRINSETEEVNPLSSTGMALSMAFFFKQVRDDTREKPAQIDFGPSLKVEAADFLEKLETLEEGGYKLGALETAARGLALALAESAGRVELLTHPNVIYSGEELLRAAEWQGFKIPTTDQWTLIVAAEASQLMGVRGESAA